MKAILALILLASGGAMALDAVSVENAWTRAMPPGSATAAVYLQLSNNSASALRLVGGHATFARKVEIHEMSTEDGMMRMRRLDGLDIPAESATEFGPGGYHLMMFGLSHVPVAGQTFTLQLRFEDDMTIGVPVAVRGVGEQ